MAARRAGRGGRLRAAVGADPEGLAAGLLALAVAVVAVVWPLASATHPPMTDLPMHAAHTAALRHFADPTWHFADQFDLRPLAVPYLSTYALGAALMTFLSPSVAVRVATGIALVLLPIGVATLARGMRKSPVLGLAAAPLCWGHLVHWGFINFVLAIGLCAMAVGLALRVVDRPSRASAVGLALVLVAVFFSHVFRYPYAVAGAGLGALAAAVAVTDPSLGWRARAAAIVRRIAPAAAATLPSLGLFAAFLVARPTNLAPDPGAMVAAPDPGRLTAIVPHLVGGFVDPAELQAARIALGLVVAVALGSLALRVAASARTTPDDAATVVPRSEEGPRAAAIDRRMRRAGLIVAGATIGLFAAGYLVLPMQIGNWWYVFPREATAAVAFAAVLLPDPPRRRGARLAVAALLGAGALATAAVPARHYARFERTTADFRRVVEHIPHGPRLLYLVFDHSGTARRVSPFLHLPAWVQAEKGGWLVFHFAVFGASPLRYRTDPGAIAPPQVPERWEWTPERFDLADHQDFFDWFLVRSREAPDHLFADDPAIERAAHEGTWWLFRKVRPGVGALAPAGHGDETGAKRGSATP